MSMQLMISKKQFFKNSNRTGNCFLGGPWLLRKWSALVWNLFPLLIIFNNIRLTERNIADIILSVKAKFRERAPSCMGS